MNILNEAAWVSRYLNDKDLPSELNRILNSIINRYYDEKQRRFNYDDFIQSKHWEEMVKVSSALKNFNIIDIASYEAQLTFWLNLFNILVLHGIGKSSTKNPLTDGKFFSDHAYQIGSDVFSLDDIEHGILRANGAKYGSIGKYFKAGDTKTKWVLHKLDARIHFCLFSACKSSPLLSAFSPDSITDQLAEQTKREIAYQVQVTSEKAMVPKIFKWYKSDFGDKNQILEFIALHSHELVKLNIQTNMENMDIKYQDFDWTLAKQ